VTLVSIVLMVTAGHGVLRLAMGTWPHRVVGPLAAAGLAALSGAVVIGLGTTYAGVSGLSTKPWPWLAPVLIVLSLAGALPRSLAQRVRLERGSESVLPTFSRATLADGVVAAACTVIGGMALVGIGLVPVRSIDEWAIWAVRGRTLSLSGHLDPLVFHGVSSNYQHLDYPLLVPSLIAWGDGAHGRLNDPAAHVLLISLVLAMLMVLGWALNRLAGPLAGSAAVLLIVGTPGLMSRWATLLTADATLVAFSLSLLCVLAMWLNTRDSRLLPAAAILGSGAVATKVEGSLFMLAIFVAAAVCVGGGVRQRRPLAVAFGVVVLSALPWLAWTKLHHLNSDQLNSATLKPGHLRDAARYAWLAAQQMVDFWPGHGWLPALVALACGGLALTVRTARRVVAFVGIAWAVITVGMWAQYVISAGQGVTGAAARVSLRGHFASSAPRVLMVPAIILTLASALFAGLALIGDRTNGRVDSDTESDSSAAEAAH
jgi:hypothetical protein